MTAGLAVAMAPLNHLPLNLIPTFFVPLLLASHVAIYRRIGAR
jgi:hypothetical protein